MRFYTSDRIPETVNQLKKSPEPLWRNFGHLTRRKHKSPPNFTATVLRLVLYLR